MVRSGGRASEGWSYGVDKGWDLLWSWGWGGGDSAGGVARGVGGVRAGLLTGGVVSARGRLEVVLGCGL